MFDLPVPGLESIAEVNCDMNKILATVSLLLVLALAALYLERVLKVPPQQPSDGKVPSGA